MVALQLLSHVQLSATPSVHAAHQASLGLAAGGVMHTQRGPAVGRAGSQHAVWPRVAAAGPGKAWSTGGGRGKPPQCSCLQSPVKG